MTSAIWQMHPGEGIERPYEYEVQAQFVREAEALFPNLYRLMNSERHRYSRDDRSKAKATWLLQMEALDSLRESLWALKLKRHRTVSALFRIADEVLDLASFLSSDDPQAAGCLARWYEDDVVPNREYRKWVARTQGGAKSAELTERYQTLSRFAHRTYRTILHGYSLGADDRLVHDRTGELYGESADLSTMLVVPQTTAFYYGVLAGAIQRLAVEMGERGCSGPEEVESAFRAAMEPGSVPWRFATARDLWNLIRTSRGTENGDGVGDRNASPGPTSA